MISNRIDSFHEQSDVILNLSQAAHVLGYKDYRKIETLINNGQLKAFKLPHTKRLRVRYKDVMRVPKQINYQKHQ